MHDAAARLIAVIGVTSLALTVLAAGAGAEAPAVALADLSATVDHPLVPHVSVPIKVFTGVELDLETGETIALRVEETVLPQTQQVAGVEVTVVNVDDHYNGVLGKTTEDYFAQGPDGAVYYLGERVDELENGKIVGHEGAWLTGENGNQPGMFMPADPLMGDLFIQERMPGIGEEQSTVIAVDQTVITPAGTFANCIVTEDVGLPDGVTEEKSYCPGVGLVQEVFPGGYIQLSQYEPAA